MKRMKEGYDARLAESLGARRKPLPLGVKAVLKAATGKPKLAKMRKALKAVKDLPKAMSAREAESKGMEKSLGKRPYSAVETMDRPKQSK